MQNHKFKEAEMAALNLLREIFGDIKQIEPPISPVKIAQYLGLNVYSSTLSNNVDGIYDKRAKSIHVSNESPPNRQHFTIAHELGHYRLHKDKEFDVFYRRDSDNLESPRPFIEQEANAFASTLLMPSALVIKYYKQHKDDKTLNIVSRLSKIFRVSESAMKWRLYNLDIKI